LPISTFIQALHEQSQFSKTPILSEQIDADPPSVDEPSKMSLDVYNPKEPISCVMKHPILDNIVHEDLAMPQPDQPFEKLSTLGQWTMCLVSEEAVREVLVNEVESHHWQL
jgi:hypothetical protein